MSLPHPDIPLSRGDLLAIFEKMGQICQKNGQVFEIAVYGGSAIMLEFEYRQSTLDIDFIPLRGGEKQIQEIANIATESLGLQKHIFRGDVSMFVSDTAKYKICAGFPKGSENLRVFTATPEYILSMKIMAMRNSLETQDLKDVWELADKCNIKNIAQATQLLEQFYPNKKVPRRNLLLLEDVFEAKAKGQKYSSSLGW